MRKFSLMMSAMNGSARAVRPLFFRLALLLAVSVIAPQLSFAQVTPSQESATPGKEVAQATVPASPANVPPPTAEVVKQLMSSYKLRAGDVISIRVFGEDDFSRDKVRLNDAGTVPFPMLGEVAVLGQTVGEIESRITTALKGRYLVNPRVTVWIEEYRPIFVNGFVERPGAYPFQPGLNVRKAVSLAGGFKERASQNKIFVVKEGDAKQLPVKVDVNFMIAPGDTIFVEESFF